MDDHARHLHALCGAGGPHCDCCNDTSPRGGKKTRRRRQRARKALAGVIRARMKREGAAEALLRDDAGTWGALLEARPGR